MKIKIIHCFSTYYSYFLSLFYSLTHFLYEAYYIKYFVSSGPFGLESNISVKGPLLLIFTVIIFPKNPVLVLFGYYFSISANI